MSIISQGLLGGLPPKIQPFTGWEIEQYSPTTEPKMPVTPYYDAKAALRTVLNYIGEDPSREGLKETPDRILRSYEELFSGYKADIESVFKIFEDGACDEMVILKGIEFYSCCEHHMLPFCGTASIAYIPDRKIIGVSKLARLLEVYARRMQVQERLTEQVTKALDTHLQPKGSACVLEASHLCMACRGVRKTATMITSSLTGVFRTKPEARAEFFSLTRG